MYTASNTPRNTERKVIFIVEDNETYSRSLKLFIRNYYESLYEIEIFPIGEMCIMELARNPNIIIIDYFLNSKHSEAINGLEIIKRIKLLKPNTNIIVLSSQENLEVISETIKQYDCIYVAKDKDAFNKVRLTITGILNREKPPAFDPMN